MVTTPRAVPRSSPLVFAPPRDTTEALSTPVVLALERLREDIEQLDALAGSKPRLSVAEGVVLFSSVAASGISAVVATAKIVELLVPACALLVAAIGVSAEYAGRVATANGKEIAAKCLQASAEAEVLLASAERSKAVIPLTVGVSATLAALSLLISATTVGGTTLLICPLLAVVASSVAKLAETDTTANAMRAQSLGRRRFACAEDVGEAWKSVTEMVFEKADAERSKWTSFVCEVVLAPFTAFIFYGGPIAVKAIVATSVAATQTAYCLAASEYAVAVATESVALKSRTAAICDAYANQGARIGAILPFTSALAGLFAAAATSLVEIQPALAVVFPALGALAAAAASVSKACCIADANAAFAVADQLSTVANDFKPADFNIYLMYLARRLRNRIFRPLRIWRASQWWRSKATESSSSLPARSKNTPDDGDDDDYDDDCIVPPPS